MEYFEYFVRGFKHYADFNGRDTRREFWMYELFCMIITAPLYVLSVFSHDLIVLYCLWIIASVLPSTAIAVRRLHDVDKSGWWILIDFIPIVGIIVLIVFLATAGNTKGNMYGDARNTIT
jgi:uncharacterized membrane protein YhaH (DUF805 family)